MERPIEPPEPELVQYIREALARRKHAQTVNASQIAPDDEDDTES